MAGKAVRGESLASHAFTFWGAQVVHISIRLLEDVHENGTSHSHVVHRLPKGIELIKDAIQCDFSVLLAVPINNVTQLNCE
eukprot:1143875-Pelagomonas_calceolata.AAC.12